MFSLLVYQLVFSADIKHWVAGFLMLVFPLVLVGHIFFIVAWSLGRSYKLLLSLFLLLMTYSIFDRTLKINPPAIKPNPPFTFSMLSYNLMYGDYHNFSGTKNKTVGEGLSAVLDTLSADIKCFQELYNTNKFKEFDLLNRISKRNQYYVYMHSNEGNDNGQGAIGLAIFSRFPIIAKKELYWPPNNNGILSADIVVGKDTIRVINVQLKSMGIRVKRILKGDNKIDKEETRNVLSKLKNGFEARGVQVNVLENWIEDSPCPVILAGDFNELPYGYAYGRVRKKLMNSFESTGFGFGFTYHKVLSFLRIDNQFFDESKVKNIDFMTYSNVPFSDHYPIKGWYLMK
ncbi:endonuclease/exonuclease/phosphatase family protein [Lacihabitans sp. LS3-19]|uniref:endonuclease/exonuclease/phosphatase family protein n=1 Tax=Lacihabitans sp. LS3-19 TaxID=2487335 RepID=UPI0020CC49D9|nr:endonuclease/exonuclease/phosphatase family protein [Lacihabitans sp. LS3-19]